jgi:ABC-type multidrug transport system fused ATPase/permease subunit
VTGGAAALEHPTGPLVRRLTRDYLRPHWPRMGAAFACMAVVAATTALNAWLMQPMLDRVFVGHD